MRYVKTAELVQLSANPPRRVTVLSALTARIDCPLGQVDATRACTCAPSICVALMPPGAMAIVPLKVIGPPVSPAPVVMLVTVPLPLASVPQTTVPSGLACRTYCPATHVPLARAYTFVLDALRGGTGAGHAPLDLRGIDLRGAGGEIARLHAAFHDIGARHRV